VVLARHATVHSRNSKSINWLDLQDAIAIFSRNADVIKPKLQSYHKRARHSDRWKTGSDFDIEHMKAKALAELTTNLFRKGENGLVVSTYGLETLVHLLSDFHTSDPRDKIYALLGIASETHNPSRWDPKRTVLTPDYSKTLFEVYRDFVKWTVKTSNSVDILCRHWSIPERELSQTGIAVQASVLPTWIQPLDHPAFDSGECIFQRQKIRGSLVGPPDNAIYHASGQGYMKIRPYVYWPPNSTSIHVTGVATGMVTSCRDSFSDGVIQADVLESLGWSFEKRATEVPEVPARLWQTLVADRGPNGTRVSPLYRRACQDILLKMSQRSHIDIHNFTKAGNLTNYEKDFLERVWDVTRDRSFIEGLPTYLDNTTHPTKKLVGLASPKTKPGDVIAVLYGCSVPVILHPADPTYQEYQFVGEAFVYGMMNGEVFEEKHPHTTFRLI
jgi:hypothetical protein